MITAAIGDLALAFEKGKQGTFLFYYSGHGTEQGSINYLVTFGVTDSAVASDGIAIPDVEKLMRKSGARQRALIIDACRSDTLQARSSSQRSFSDLQASEGFLVLYAAQATRRSYEDDQFQHGIFTHFLIKGLQGEAAGTDGLVSCLDLAHFTERKVKQYSIEHGTAQFPYSGGESSGDFVIALSKGPDERTNDIDGQRYVYMPAGRFVRGCSPGDEECVASEKPAVEIDITRGFWIGKSEVTVGAWRRYWNPQRGPRLPDEDQFNRALNAASGNDSFPALAMTWKEAKDFCQWAGMRLPTEAEWEYAARAGDNQSRYGNLNDIAWYADNSGRRSIDAMEILREDKTNFAKRLFQNGNGPKPVGTKLANAKGLFDMLGNAWEWTSDWFGADYYAQSDRENPAGPIGGSFKVIRGGSWSTYASGIRVSARDRQDTEIRLSDIGFRCAGESLPAIRVQERRP
jgi:formylglycine-generating enzyme required for sulfatase activity